MGCCGSARAQTTSWRTAAAGSMEGLVLYFFVSYANGDDDPYVEQFFDDLVQEIRNLDPEPNREDVGFLDSDSLKLGTPWLPRLDDALSTCRCFVALCSPRYFVSEFCGKEWSVFEARARQYEELNGYAAAALLPVMWQPMREMHPAAATIQYRSRNLGATYHKHGLRSLVRLKRFKDDYQLFILALAQHIVDTARNHPLPPPLFGLNSDRIRSAFHSINGPSAEPAGDSGIATGTATGRHWPPAISAGAPTDRVSQADNADQTRSASESSSLDEEREPGSAANRPGGPGTSAPTGTVSVTNRRVHFVIAVGRPEELRQLGRSLHFYGAEFHEWAPYRP